MAIKSFGKKFGWAASFCALLFVGLLFTGCQTPQSFNSELSKLALPTNALSADIFRPGDALTIIFSDTPPPGILPFEERVKDDGTIRLIHNQDFVAAGRTRGALEKEIHDRYVTNYYLNLTVNIKQQARFYFVDGQVKIPSKQEYVGPTTILRAIASAGGFNEYAKPTAVQLTHENGESKIVNCKKALKNPLLDLPVYPGDRINVPRRVF